MLIFTHSQNELDFLMSNFFRFTFGNAFKYLALRLTSLFSFSKDDTPLKYIVIQNNKIDISTCLYENQVFLCHISNFYFLDPGYVSF